MDWFRGVLRPLLLDTLTTRAIGEAGVFDAAGIHRSTTDHTERRINAGYQLCGLLTLFLWMRRWKVEPPAVADAPEFASAVHTNC
jgi:asparagine synthase (glutamine-hydrolysing)